VLLARRFSPPAVAGFLVASQRRAGEVRRARPELARRSRAWIAVGAAAYLLPLPRRPRTAAAWWAATWLMLDWHLGMVETQGGRPRNLAAADAMTLARVWMVPVALEAPTAPLALAAFATDVLDGRLARASEPTRIGRDLEGLADSAFAAAALRGAVRRGWLAPAIAYAEAARLGVGFAYALGVYFGSAQRPAPAVTRAARVTTPVRVAGLVAAGVGRPALAAALVGGGAAWSVAAVARALARRSDDRPR
jgi:phosphatidylglycerophosphate synthase